VKVPLEMEDGHGLGLPGLWGAAQQHLRNVQGGLRYAPDVTLEAGPVARLADDVGGDTRTATYGEAKGGIAVDIKELT
jgi:hypothetical protein